MKNIKKLKKTFHSYIFKNLNKQNLLKFHKLYASSFLLQNEKFKKLKKFLLLHNRWINTNINNLYNQYKPQNIDKLTPWQVTGFIDGEGSFSVSNTGNSIKLEMKATQKKNSPKILYKMKEYFDCGSVVIDNRKTETLKYRVSSLNDILTKIIPHFDKYPCLTSKFLNYQDWKKIAIKMSNKKKEHLTLEGLKKIKSIIINMNKGRSFEDKYNHCRISLGLTSNENITKILPADWVQGFLSGEGFFYNYIAK